jgi:lipopolysaccharide biosynthesis glycosyltransferase
MAGDLSSSPVEVVCACDEGFLPHTAAMLCSLLDNAGANLRVWHLHDGIPGRELNRMAGFVSRHDAAYEDRVIDTEVLSGLKISLHASPANYFRLLMPEVLPRSVQRVIYLDSDMIIRRPLDELWSVSLGDAPLGAVENSGNTFSNHVRIGLSYDQKYFNSGVLLVDLAQWRSSGLHFEVLEFVRENPKKIKFWDQDGLNAVLAGRWHELPMKWNVSYSYFLRADTRARYPNILENPGIIHFCGDNWKSKPWYEKHPFNSEYKELLMRTPWGRGPISRTVHKPFEFVRDKFISYLHRGAWNDRTWGVAEKVLFVPKIMFEHRRKKQELIEERDEIQRRQDQVADYSEDLTVREGPFEGLKFPGVDPLHRCLLPKLMGTYEAEIHESLEGMLDASTSNVVNVGSAEGYYAAGLAMRMPESRIFAYDKDSADRERCREMVELNGVQDQVEVGDGFWLGLLEAEIPPGDGLLLITREEDETMILNPREPGWEYMLQRYDVLVELHEFKRPGVSGYLRDLFADTHKIDVIRSVPDPLRPAYFESKVIVDEAIETRQDLMAEGRESEVEWFHMKRRGV